MNTFGRGRSLSTWRPAAYAEDSELSSSRWEYIFSKLQKRKRVHTIKLGFVLFFFKTFVGSLPMHTVMTFFKRYFFPFQPEKFTHTLFIQLISCYICGTHFESEMCSYYCTTQ